VSPVFRYRKGDTLGTSTITIFSALEITKYVAKMDSKIKTPANGGINAYDRNSLFAARIIRAHIFDSMPANNDADEIVKFLTGQPSLIVG